MMKYTDLESGVKNAIEAARQDEREKVLAMIDGTRENWEMSADYMLVEGFEDFFKECLKTFCRELKSRIKP